LILFIIFMPQGIVGLIEGISARAVRGSDDATALVGPAASEP
jgi:hypothetical protein